MQYTFYFDQTRCTTCSTCLVACKDWHDVNPGSASARKIHTKEVEGTFPDTKTYVLVYGCNHCDDPACVKSCSANAIYKREEDGIVILNRDKCQGFGTCLDACPYKAPQRADQEVIDKKRPQESIKKSTWKIDHPAFKCDACIDRVLVGKVPVCVSSCPQRALDFGTSEYIINKYPNAKKVAGENVKYMPTDACTYAPAGTKPNLYINQKS